MYACVCTSVFFAPVREVEEPKAHLVDGLLVAVADDLLDAVHVLAVAVDLVPPVDEVKADAAQSRSGRKQTETEDSGMQPRRRPQRWNKRGIGKASRGVMRKEVEDEGRRIWRGR